MPSSRAPAAPSSSPGSSPSSYAASTRQARPDGGLDDQTVLEPVDLGHVLGMDRVDQDPRDGQRESTTDLVAAAGVDTGVVQDPVDVAVLVHDHDRQVAAPGVGQRDRKPSAASTTATL